MKISLGLCKHGAEIWIWLNIDFVQALLLSWTWAEMGSKGGGWVNVWLDCLEHSLESGRTYNRHNF